VSESEERSLGCKHAVETVGLFEGGRDAEDEVVDIGGVVKGLRVSGEKGVMSFVCCKDKVATGSEVGTLLARDVTGIRPDGAVDLRRGAMMDDSSVRSLTMIVGETVTAVASVLHSLV